MQLNRIFGYLYFLATTIEVVRNIFEWPFEQFSKPILMILLGIYFISSGVKRDINYGLILGAIACSWLGDYLLMFQQNDPKFFMAGLGSFLLAHLFYSACFYRLKWSTAENPLLPTQKLRHSITLILVGVALITILSPGLGAMRLPVIVYAGVIVFMSIMALLRYGYTPINSFGLVFGGAIMFMISDSLLAINKFKEPISYAGFWIMLTYCLAQFLIVKGLVSHLKNK